MIGCGVRTANRRCERSEAIQTLVQLDCFAPLATTGYVAAHSLFVLCTILGVKRVSDMGRAAKERGADGTPVIIKKYANRRLYNTETSAYITLDDLAKMTRVGRDFQVLDAKTSEDITHTVLTQIIMDEESRGGTMLPAGFLRQLISMYGDSMQGMVPQYLEASMDAFRRNHDQFRTALEGALTAGPFGELAKRNLAMFEAAASAFRPKSAKDDEVAALKAQMAALQAKLDALGK
jgi:polyhydroxyalkanoate synthesis repressor PhaR